PNSNSKKISFSSPHKLHPVLHFHHTFADGIQLSFDKLSFKWLQFLNEKKAFNMVIFMLNDSGIYTCKRFNMLHKIFVQIFDTYHFRPVNITTNHWNTQATFLVGFDFAGFFYFLSIDEYFFDTLILFSLFHYLDGINDKKPDG